jgi:hypothetical protein
MPYRDAPNVPGLQELLSEQHGVVTVAQLKAAGVSPELARARVRAGRWQRPHRGVYVVFSGTLDRAATIWAAVLRCGPGAVASFQTAAELEGLSDERARHIHVTVESGRVVKIAPSDGIRVHYSKHLPDRRHPVKLPPRTRLEETVLDLVAASKTTQTAAAWIIAAVRKRLTTPARLLTALSSRKRVRWRRLVEAMLADVAEGVQSMLELEHLWKVQRAHGLPSGVRQRRVVTGGRVIWVDLDLDEFALRIELDGRLGHVDEGAFRDRRRDNNATVSGRATLRYGHAEVFGTPCDVGAEEAKVYQDRGWTGEPRPCSLTCTIGS